jgi:hypothetical protein
LLQKKLEVLGRVHIKEKRADKKSMEIRAETYQQIEAALPAGGGRKLFPTAGFWRPWPTAWKTAVNDGNYPWNTGIGT